jgi:PHD/YefM family antitoxin component YafN of YafNO toxin-antitoxin module
MNIQLTPQQLQTLDADEEKLPRVVDPRNNVAYVLVSESEYETVRDVLEDEQRQRSIRAVALRNAIGRMDEMP